MSLVRENLMTRQGYSPYCGNDKCWTMPRTTWNGDQFQCHCCGWLSAFPADFIAEYKAKWGIVSPVVVGGSRPSRSIYSALATGLALSLPYSVPGPGPGRVRTYRGDFYAPTEEQQRRDQAAKDKRERRRLRNIKNDAALKAGLKVAP